MEPDMRRVRFLIRSRVGVRPGLFGALIFSILSPQPLAAQAAPSRPRLEVATQGHGLLRDTPIPLRLYGDPNQTYVIQATSEFSTWTTISTNRTDASGVAIVTDSQSGQFNQRYYRARLLAPLELGFRPDRILVKPRVGADLSLLLAAHGATVLRAYPAIGNLHVLQL